MAYTYWFALKLSVQPIRRNSGNQEATDKISSIRKWAWVILLFIFFQLIYGALMAGHKAANVASTWPTINGQWIPTGLLSKDQFLLNAVNNTIWIHFVHRGLAYVLLVLIIIWSTQLFKLQGNNFWVRARLAPPILVFIQILLGIFTVLSSVHIIPGVWGGFEWLAQLHQLTGMLLLLSVINILYATK